MIRRVAMLCFALLALLSGPLVAAAKVGTPVAGGPGGPDVRTAVSWIGNEGTELAKVTVTDVTDPFQKYDPSAPPQRGFHFVLIDVTVENTGTAPVSVDPSTFGLVDADGFVARYTGLYRSAEDTAAKPDFQYGDVAPGSSVSGVIGFQVLNGVEIDRVVFVPDSSRLITLVDLRTKRTPLGAAVSLIGTEGTEIGQVTVNSVTDPFQDYDPSASPQRGSHYVLIDVTIANTGTRPLTAYPNGFYVLDQQGFLAYQSYLYRTADSTTASPDFAGGDIAPGASMAGVIGYQLLNGTEVDAVLYAPDFYNQQVIVGEPAAGGSPQVKPTPRATAAATQATAVATAARPASAADCEGIETWAQETLTRIAQLQTIVAPISALATQPKPTIDPVQTRQIADQLQTLADDQRNSNPPPAAEALNTVIADTYQKFSDAINHLADAGEKSDVAGITAAGQEFADAGKAFDPDGDASILEASLETACPVLKTLLGG